MHGSGVYMIRDTVSGRRYIGSAVRLWNRRRQHFQSLARGDHHSRFMQKTWNKRPEALEFSIVLYCDKENLLMYEQILLDAYKPEFNTAPVAGSQLGFKHGPESRKKMSDSRRKDFSPMTGKKHTEQTKAKISESRKGKGGDKGWTQERRDRISAALKGRVITDDMRKRISDKLTGNTTGRGQLTEDQVREVRKIRSEKGWGSIRIAKVIGCTKSAAQAVLGNHAYLWVT